MRRVLVLSIASAAVMVGAAQATARPLKAPVRAPVVETFSWTGYYVGVNVGYGWGDADVSSAGTGSSITFPGVIPVPNSYSFGGAHKQKLDGIIGGGQVGYNYQYSPKWIFGFEADIQGSNQRGSGTLFDAISGTVCTAAAGGPPIVCLATTPFNGAAVTAVKATIDWFGTVRGRVGWLVTEKTLLYATGGLAYGHVGISGNSSVSGQGLGVTFLSQSGIPASFSASKTNVGFVVGGGIEGKFTAWLPQNWSWKMEYLYLDLGSINVSMPFTSVSGAPGNTTNITGTINHHAHITDNIVRVGINYKFN